MLSLLHHFFHPTNCYALCAVARSGAHLLTGGLRATHLAGRPLQYFNDQLAQKYAARYGLDLVHFAQYVRGIVAAAATSNAVFGFRIECWDIERFVTRLRESGEFGPPRSRESQLLRTALPRLRYIQLTRQDKLAQAISKARALQTDLWAGGKEKPAAGEARFDPALIDQCLFSAQHAEEVWRDFFQRNEIGPLAITYEDLCLDYPATVRRVLNFLHIRLPRRFAIGPPSTVRQADAINAEWAERYRALRPEALNRKS
jgi:LPS sulfotransferase NodH